jgi:hypothetical protein
MTPKAIVIVEDDASIAELMKEPWVRCRATPP